LKNQKQFNVKTGAKGEDIGAAYLVEQGYRVLERNVKARFGEIDLVAKEGDTLVFVEIKTRRSTGLGFPEEAVNRHKQRQLSRLAAWYLQSRHLDRQKARFDVVSVLGLEESATVRIFKNAFEAIE